MPIKIANGTSSIANILLKNGSPIEILPKPISLCTIGNKVPNNTIKVATTKKILFSHNATSRDTNL